MVSNTASAMPLGTKACRRSGAAAIPMTPARLAQRQHRNRVCHRVGRGHQPANCRFLFRAEVYWPFSTQTKPRFQFLPSRL
jgi:hypothetical protein